MHDQINQIRRFDLDKAANSINANASKQLIDTCTIDENGAENEHLRIRVCVTAVHLVGYFFTMNPETWFLHVTCTCDGSFPFSPISSII